MLLRPHAHHPPKSNKDERTGVKRALSQIRPTLIQACPRRMARAEARSVDATVKICLRGEAFPSPEETQAMICVWHAAERNCEHTGQGVHDSLKVLRADCKVRGLDVAIMPHRAMQFLANPGVTLADGPRQYRLGLLASYSTRWLLYAFHRPKAQLYSATFPTTACSAVQIG